MTYLFCEPWKNKNTDELVWLYLVYSFHLLLYVTASCLDKKHGL